MAANSTILLPSNSHDNTSNDTPYTGEKFKGAGFYGMGDGFHTVQFQVTTFTGSITIQGSLATDPSSNDWVDITISPQGAVYSVDTTGLISQIGSLAEFTADNESLNKTYNFTGNFVWIRANVTTWTHGQVNRVLLNF